jgi:hypothetical protein
MTENAGSRLTMKEAALYLGHSYSWMFSNHRTLGLNGYRIGGRWYFNLEELKNWENRLRTKNKFGANTNISLNKGSERISIA